MGVKEAWKKGDYSEACCETFTLLARHVDIDNPEKVKEYILAKNCTEGHKDNLVDAYSHYVQHCGLTWQKPSYMRYGR